MRVLSLFDGISCAMVALERAGIVVDEYVAYEIDENAIQISNYNYPNIIHKGDVFKAIYNEGEFDILLGGSPCTYWSIAQLPNKREVTASGIGWELFMQYVRALREVKPKYFLYENNFSMAKEIKEEITKQLGVEPIMINSALVSGQNRKRLYWTNIPNVTMPEDRHIYLKDIINWEDEKFRPVSNWVYSKWGDRRKIDALKTVDSLKSHTLTTKNTHSWAYYLNRDKTQYCNLKVSDWEMLQTLPIGYCMAVPLPNTALYKAIGNGWTVDVIAHILSFIGGNDDNNNT